jgi:expansin (peptidoglycan-binding protein)|nr:expansin EXLX1 family cellulose-binding protein [Kofleriaceae bacterium]
MRGWLVLIAVLAACGTPMDIIDSDGGGSDLGSGSGGGSGSSAACGAAPAGESGQATYYDADGTGACSFDAGSDFLIAAMNATDYGDAVWCGGCVDVAGPNGHVTVRIVDKCPGCSQGSLDLSETAFAKIAPLSAGRVDITWQETACPVTGPISYDFQDGSSQFYTAIQIRNHRYPIAAVATVDATGSATPIARVDYNYFVATKGLGTGPYKLRVTDDRGETLDDTGVALDTSSPQPGAAQFPICP